eukprot:2860174-Rhodomonas_salina.1
MSGTDLSPLSSWAFARRCPVLTNSHYRPRHISGTDLAYAPTRRRAAQGAASASLLLVSPWYPAGYLAQGISRGGVLVRVPRCEGYLAGTQRVPRIEMLQRVPGGYLAGIQR